VPPQTQASYYRTAVDAEIDLLLELPGNWVWAVETKRSSARTVSRGFLRRRGGHAPHRGEQRQCHISDGGGIEHLPLLGLMQELLALREEGALS
jgi:hypothetical protein